MPLPEYSLRPCSRWNRPKIRSAYFCSNPMPLSWTRSSIPCGVSVPLTTTNRGWDNHVLVPDDGTGLEKPSWAMVEHVQSVSPLRFTRRIGIAPDEVVHEITDWITDML